MKNTCFDEGTIQAFLDGELASDLLETTARHLSVCGDCAAQLAAAEEETAFAYSALETEFNTLVPTQRLWMKINDSIERERRSFWNSVFAFFRNPAIATFAAFLVVFGLFVAYLNSANNNSTDIASAPTKMAEKPVAPTTSTASKDDVTNPPADDPTATSDTGNEKAFKTVEANFEQRAKRVNSQEANLQKDAPKPQPAYQYLPGEESYIKTIATLEKTVEDSKDEVLKPSARVSYEKDLALVNDAIKKLQTEVRKNPRNESAKQVLMDSYQNKVDLLNSVSQKTELMASLNR